MLYAEFTYVVRPFDVVMDEVHFLADRMRGAVWEEVILHLPDEARGSLSATVSRCRGIGGWIRPCAVTPPLSSMNTAAVPLWQHVLVGKWLFDLFD